MSKHKILGQVFTPKWIVNEILDLIDYQGTKILDKYILEPSSGDEAFLNEIVKRYIETCKNSHLQNNAIKERLEKYIFAVELDETEYKKIYCKFKSFSAAIWYK